MANDTNQTYGQFIAEHRKKSGFKSQSKLADKTNISRATISRIEKEIQRPTFETIKTLAPFLTSTTQSELLAVCGYASDDVDNKKTSTTNAQMLEKDLNDMTDEELLERFQLVHKNKKLTEKQAKFFIKNLRMLAENLEDLD